MILEHPNFPIEGFVEMEGVYNGVALVGPCLYDGRSKKTILHGDAVEEFLLFWQGGIRSGASNYRVVFNPWFDQDKIKRTIFMRTFLTRARSREIEPLFRKANIPFGSWEFPSELEQKHPLVAYAEKYGLIPLKEQPQQ